MIKKNISKSLKYIKDGDLKVLDKINEKTCNGFCIIFDIKDSAQRKEEYKFLSKWVEHTTLFYKAFNQLTQDLKKIRGLDLVVKKFNGDGVMCFLKTTESVATPENRYLPEKICKDVLEKVILFRKEIQAIEKLCQMKLKTILTYLTDIHLVNISYNTCDVLGKNLDFAFRMESFSGVGYIAINDVLYKNLFSFDSNQFKQYKTIEFDEKYFTIKIKKRIRGWVDPQEFYIIVSQSMLDEAILDLHSDINEKNLSIDLLKYYYDTMVIGTKNSIKK